MDRDVFFAELRKRRSGIFGCSISRGQREATEAILDAGQSEGMKTVHLAYRLALVYLQTGGRMRPGRVRNRPKDEDRENLLERYASAFQLALVRGRYLCQAPQPRPFIPPEDQSIPPAWVPPVKATRTWLTDMLDKIRSVLA